MYKYILILYIVACCLFRLNASMPMSFTDLLAFSGEVVLILKKDHLFWLIFLNHTIQSYVRKLYFAGSTSIKV